MNECLYTPRELSELLGVTQHTLAEWEKEGKIKATKTKGGHRRYIYSKIKETTDSSEGKKYIYARVSSKKQFEDLQRQVNFLQEKYPNYEVIQDIGSGINFKRKGLITLLDNVLGGNVSHIVVAHRDRLARFGFDMFSYLFQRFKVSITVVQDNDIKEPATELAEDLLSIVTVFTARYYGSRKYTIHSEDKNISEYRAKKSVQQMPRRVKVLLQSRSSNGRKKITTRR